MKRRSFLVGSSALALAGALSMVGLRGAGTAPCDSLKALSLPRTTMTAATLVAAGTFKPPVGAGFGGPPGVLPPYQALPAFCRVEGVIAPSQDSHIEFEVWLPATGWNGKYHGEGNGGFAGYIGYGEMAAALLAGYATSSTDTGHRAGGTDGRWALGHLEKLTDYGYRAIHETADVSKAVIHAFYGEPPRHAYFAGCSNGGRQALMEAQRYPADYDGIIAGAPAAYFTHIIASFAWDLLATEVESASYVPARKFAAVEAAVVAACDTRDGVKDGVIDDPTSCAFDPGTLRCQGDEQDTCLTDTQIGALRKIYAGPRSSKGEQFYPGFLPGGESGQGGWPLWVSGLRPGSSAQYLFSTQGNAYLIFQNPAYDYRKFDIDHDVRIADETRGAVLNAVDPNLKAFKARGGKLIVFHGWSDAALAPMATVDYFNRVVSTMGTKEAEDVVRLYMVPGMQHCGGGPGTDSFGWLPSASTDPSRSMSAALERWVEHGEGPQTVIATKGQGGSPASSEIVRSRPLCPYPQVAAYRGSGSTDDASNFECRKPSRDRDR